MLKKLKTTLDDLRKKLVRSEDLSESESEEYELLKKRSKEIKAEIEQVVSELKPLNNLLKKDRNKLEKLLKRKQRVLEKASEKGKSQPEELVAEIQEEIDELNEAIEKRTEAFLEKRREDEVLNSELQRIYTRCQIILLNGFSKHAQAITEVTFESSKEATVLIGRLEKTILEKEAKTSELFRTASKILEVDLKVATEELAEKSLELEEAICEIDQVLSEMSQTTEQLNERIDINSENVETWISREAIAEKQGNIDLAEQCKSRADQYRSANVELEEVLKEQEEKFQAIESMKDRLKEILDEVRIELADRPDQSSVDGTESREDVSGPGGADSNDSNDEKAQ